jgi:rRNA maturation endonuclease Nob1
MPAWTLAEATAVRRADDEAKSRTFRRLQDCNLSPTRRCTTCDRRLGFQNKSGLCTRCGDHARRTGLARKP